MRFTRLIHIALSVTCLLVLVAGCQQSETASENATETVATETAEAAPAQAAKPVVIEGFQTPESVLYDSDRDIYYVSNINGGPLDVDGNGFISRVTADGRAVEARWIEGGKQDVTLNAPKGMAIVNGELWVTDITTIRRFDLSNGQPKGEIPIEGTSFLNDLAVGTDGAVYASDSGLKGGDSGFEPTGTDAIYRISADGTVEKIAEGNDLNRPNGLTVNDHGIWVVTFGARELYRIEDGKKADVVELPAGSLDGVLQLPTGDFLVSSWEGKAVYRGPAEGPFQPVIENVESPADIGYDTKRDLVLIPDFNGNQISLHPLPATHVEM